MGELIPIVAIVCAIGVPLMIPIVAIMAAHQRKMAELYRQGGPAGQPDAGTLARVGQLEAEVAQLRELVHEQTIALDNLKSLPGPQNLPSDPG